jgi:hypothetical protein
MTVSEKNCYVCARASSEDPKGEMDGAAMYLRGLLHGLNLSRPEVAMDRLLHGNVLCQKHQSRAEQIVQSMLLVIRREGGKAGASS